MISLSEQLRMPADYEDYAYYEESLNGQDYDGDGIDIINDAKDYLTDDVDYTVNYLSEILSDAVHKAEQEPSVHTTDYNINTFGDCLYPSIRQISTFVAVFIFTSIAYRFICSQMRRRISEHNRQPFHMVGFICGIVMLSITLRYLAFVVLLLCCIMYILLVFCMKYVKLGSYGFIIAAITIISQFVYESMWQEPEAWHTIRGMQMVANMKIISLAYDIEDYALKAGKLPVLPKFQSYLGYIFCPMTCSLGPWISYHTYIHNVRNYNVRVKQSLIVWPLSTLCNLCMSLWFLIASNCLTTMLRNDQANTIWAILYNNYIDAFSVRCSHYFITFLAQAGMSAGGLIIHHSTHKNHHLFGSLITKPWRIEYPLSLNSLVRVWNIPMHDWLKKYIFRGALRRFNNHFLAVLFTYLVSSLLHGKHIRIYLVLLSLGVFAYVEYKLRVKFALIFDACIGPNYCKNSCGRRHCLYRKDFWSKGYWLLKCAKIFLSLFAIFQITYLGAFLSESDPNDDDQNMRWNWEQTGYFNHYFTLSLYVFYLFIS